MPSPPTPQHDLPPVPRLLTHLVYVPGVCVPPEGIEVGKNGSQWPALAEVVGWIREAGGIATLAHPARYALSAGGRRQLLADFVAAGGAALEVVTGGNGAQHAEACAMLAVKFGLLGSVGSDFHDPRLTWNPLGRLAKLPDCVVPVWRSHA